ncbi:hypothetical protein AUR65_008920 [Haloferax marisrubri]|uniref:Glycosyl transferase family 1 domain-containing protein n=2 Tax=Haloferax marisrubri TaxID=1544719 RepID=A0A2P4NQV3_9EURY|nr:hypothetical protein AUR65_008920 [Haloferax marisrubri]
MSTYRRIECNLESFLANYCDGMIAVSQLVSDYLRIKYPNMPVSHVAPHIDENLTSELSKTRPQLEAKKATFVGFGRDHKGVDILVNNWPKVREIHPSAELSIVGQKHPSSYEQVPGVKVKGYVDDLVDELNEASLYVHPARIDPFAVSVTEAMAAGLPAIVTETTGAKEAVKQVNSDFVVQPIGAKIVEEVNRYFELEVNERTTFSNQSRTIANCYSKESQCNAFFDAYNEIISCISA